MQCLRAIKHVIKEYPNTALDDLKGTEDNPCLVVRLSHIDTKLSVDVFRTQSTPVSIAIVPSLLEQGVHTDTVSALQDSNRNFLEGY